MPNLCKRIIALSIAICLVVASFPSAFADDETVTAQHRPTVWECIIDGTDTTLRTLFNSVVGVFRGSDYCGFTSSGKHEGSEVLSKSVGSNGEYVFTVRCTGCGGTFLYRGSDAQSQYNDSLHDSGLDNGLAVIPATDDSPSGFVWYPTLDDFDKERSYFSNYNNPVYLSQLPITLTNDPHYENDYFRVSGRSFECGYSSERGYSSNGFQCFSNPMFLIFPVSGTYTVLAKKMSDAYTTSSSGSSYFTQSSLGHKDAGSVSQVFSFETVPLSGVAPHNWTFYFPDLQVVPDSSTSVPSVPSTININNTTYNVTDIDLETRTVHTTENYTIEYGDTEIKIYDGPTEIKVIQYVIENPSDPDPGPGGDTSDPDPGPGGDTSDPDPGPGGDGSGSSGCCEQCQILLRQANQYLLQIQTLVDQINDKLGDDGDNYTQGIYNLLVEIKSALENLPSEPHKDYEEKLNLIANQLANIWGDLETIKTSLSAVETNTTETNEKLDSVHEDLEAVLAELQTQRGILQQILDTLKKILGHVTTIDENVEELKDEESSNNFFNNFILKFHFLGDIFSIIRQLFADITNDAATVQLVDDGTLPIGDLSSQHFPIDGSPVAIGTAPEVLTRFPDDKYHGVDLSSYSALDLSWYARYKSRVDALLSGFLWIGYIWLLFKRAPGIVRGAAMVDETNIKIDDFRNGG